MDYHHINDIFNDFESRDPNVVKNEQEIYVSHSNLVLGAIGCVMAFSISKSNIFQAHSRY